MQKGGPGVRSGTAQRGVVEVVAAIHHSNGGVRPRAPRPGGPQAHPLAPLADPLLTLTLPPLQLQGRRRGDRAGSNHC